MTSVTLKPITLTFTQTFKISVEDYIEWCEDYGYTPSQKGYKKFVIKQFEEELWDEIDENNFTFKYGKEKEYEYGEPEYVSETESSFDYGQYVADLSEEEIEKFHKLCDEDKMTINPFYSSGNIITMNSNEDVSLYYGIKYNKETGEITCIKKSILAHGVHHLYQYLRTL